jgi:hypothetical protein
MNDPVRGSEDDDLDRLLRGVGQVCIAASLLESTLAYVCMIIDRWDDDKYDDVLGKGRTMQEYEKITRRLEAAKFGPGARSIYDNARNLFDKRHRVVHSVMMTEMKMGRFYDAWHPKTGKTWPVDPVDLRQLAVDLERCNHKAGTFADDWAERAEREGWPEVP